jgi:hypothetical protein
MDDDVGGGLCDFFYTQKVNANCWHFFFSFAIFFSAFFPDNYALCVNL